MSRYEEMAAQFAAEDKANRASLTLTSTKTPEQSADIYSLSSKAKLPAGAVEQDPASVRRQLERERLEKLANESPLVSRWVAEPQNYELAKDDLDSLSLIEKGFSALMPMTSGLVKSKRDFAPLLEQLSPSTKKLFSDVLIAGSDMQGQFEQNNGLDFTGSGNPLREAMGLKKNKLASEVSREQAIKSAGYAAESESLASQYDDGSAKYYLAQFGRSLPIMGGSILGGLANPALGASILFSGSSATVYSDSLAEGNTKSDAAIVGLGSGAIESITELPVLKALKLGAQPAFKGISKFIDGLLETRAGRVAAIGTAEAAGELVANPSQMALEEAVTEKDYTVGDYGRALRDSAVLGFTMGGVIAGIAPGVSQSPEAIIRRAIDHKNAKTEKGFLDVMVNSVENTKLKKLVPEKLEEAINNMSDQTVFLPIEAVQTYFQGAGLDTEQAVFDLTGSDTAYEEAVATGGEIAIPLGRYASRVGADAHKVLGESARLTAGQSVKPNTEMPDNAEFESQLQEAMAEAQTNPTRSDDESGEVFDAVFGQLADNTDRTAATQYAAVAQAFYGNMAKRNGMKPMELFNQFKINIPGMSQAKQQKAKVDAAYDPVLDALRAKRSFTDKEVKGQGLVSALIAAGGIQPNSVGAPNLKKIVDKGRVGLFNQNGMTLDDAVIWAKANGYAFDTNNEQAGLYDSDGFDINALSDLIDEDIKRGVYAPENMNEKRAAFNEAVDSMAEMLDAAGIDIKTMTNEEIKSLLMGEQTFEQGAVDIDQILEEYGEPVANSMDAERRWSNGDRIFRVAEQDGMAAEVLAFDELKNSAYDELIAIKKSVADNAGVPDRGAARILYQSANDVFNSLEFKRWFGDKSIEELEANYASLVDKNGNNRTDDGHRIDTDLVRELSPEYRADRSLSQDMHSYASALTKELFARALARPVREGKAPVVAFLAGGGGSGKSTATDGQLESVAPDITFDGTLSKLDSARRDIESALASGREAVVMLVYRSPENSVSGAIGRAIKMGRPVPIWALAEAHSGAPKVAKALAKEYDSNVKVLVQAIWNDGDKNAIRTIPVEEIPNVDQQQAEQTFREAVESAREQGKIDQALSDRFLAPKLEGTNGTGVRQQHETESGNSGRNSVTHSQPADGGNNRGSVNVRKQADGTIEFDIHLFKKANFSTFLHESGHAYLEIMQALAKREGAPADIVADWQKIKDYFKQQNHAKTLATVLRNVEAMEKEAVSDPTKLHAAKNAREAYDFAVKNGGAKFMESVASDFGESLPDKYKTTLVTPYHEIWARSFEAYLREGKAPSNALRKAFVSFKLWLTRIYKTAEKLDAELSDDIRGVMDRMLASDAEIAEASKAQNLGALFKDRLAEDWDQETFEAYAKQVEAVQAEVENALAAELLKAEQDAQAAWYKAELKTMQDEVALELSRQPVFVAQQILRNGKFGNGDPAPEQIRVHLDKADLLDMYGAEYLKRLKGLYRIEGGISANEAAVLFGFPNGTALVEALVNIDSFGSVVKREAQALMDEKYPDPMKDGSLPQKAMQALHADHMAELLVKEINMLEKRSGKKITTLQVMKEAARRMIAEKQLRNIRPHEYLHAEQKAGREAIEAAAKKDWEAARVARRMQLLNHQLYKAALDGKELAAKQHKYLRRFIDGDKRAEIGKASEEHLNAIDEMLSGVDWRKGANKNTGRGKSWRDLSMNELKAIHDAVEEAYHAATIEGIIMDGDRKVNAAIVDMEMSQSVADAHGVKPPQYGLETAGQKVEKEWRIVRALAGAATDLARELDGHKDGGSVWSNTVRIIHEAMNNRVLPALQKAQEREAEIYLKHYTKKELRELSRKGRKLDGVPGEWSKEQILTLGLNWGNEGNREAILSQAKKPLNNIQVAKLLGSLDSRDWAFIQDIWGMIDSHWAEISDTAQRRKGLRPSKVDGAPFSIRTSDGKMLELKGGYFPLKGEADSAKTSTESVDDFYEAIRAGTFSKASTKDGHTIERVGFGGRTVRLDLGVISQHQRDVLRDIHLGDAVNYVHQTLNGHDFTGAVEDAGMLDNQKALKQWLKDVAAGEIGLQGKWNQGVRALRTNFTASVLTFKVVSAALQITGVIQSSVVVGHNNMLWAAGQYSKNPLAAVRHVDEASNYMRMRAQTQVEAVEQLTNAQSSAYAAGKATMIRYGYYMIGRVQRIVDVNTWLAAEKKGIETFGDDRAKVIAYADDVVKRAQGSGTFEDKTSIQRGSLGENVRQSETIRGFTTLMGYMIAKNNVLIEQATKAKKAGGYSSAIKMSFVMVELFVLEALIVAAIRGNLPDDEDEDGYMDDLLAFSAKEGMYGLLGGVPGLSQFGTELRGYDAKGIVANASESVVNAMTQAEQGEFDKALVKSFVGVAGVSTGFPAGQTNKTIDALAAAEDGEDVALYEYLTGLRK